MAVLEGASARKDLQGRLRRRTAVVALLALVALAVPVPASAALVARYDFQNTFEASTPGAPAMTPVGDIPHVFRTETVLGEARTVLAFACQTGLRVDTPSLAADEYSIAVLMRLSNMSGYNRIIDFNEGVGDDGLYILNGALNFFPVVTAEGTQFSEDVYAQVVLTRTAAGSVTGYVNGTQALTFDDAQGLARLEEGVLQFFRDNDSGGGPTTEASAGAVAAIQLFDHVLSAGEVAALEDTPPAAPPPTLSGDSCDQTPPAPDEETPRIDGEDVQRIAINVCEFLFDQPDAATAVVLARDDVFADALAGSPLAGDDSCVLYTAGGPGQPLDPETRLEIDRVLRDGGPIRILGGHQAVSAQAEAELVSAGYAVDRLQGATRFETAVEVARVVHAENPGTDALLAYGINFPDAVTGGAYGAETGTPILLTDTAQLHPATAAAIQELGISRTFVLGGTAVISDAAAAAAPGSERVAGANRMATAAQVAEQLWGTVLDDVDAVVVTNIERPDGWALTLASAPVSARRDAPQLGTGATTYPGETSAYLQSLPQPAARAFIIGNQDFISDAVAAAIAEDVGEV